MSYPVSVRWEKLRQLVRPYLGPLVFAARSLIRSVGSLEHKSYLRRVIVPEEGISVCYLTRRFPNSPGSRSDFMRGGAVKMTYLEEAMSHSAQRFNILYAVSSVFHPQTATIISEAKRRGIKIVWNQNGVYYRGWYGPGWQRPNSHLAQTMQMSDSVIYQSQFCKQSADTFLGEFTGPQTVLHNPVDVDYYTPQPKKPVSDELVLLTVNSNMSHRLECALLTLSQIKKTHPKTRLIVPGLGGKHPGSIKVQPHTKRLISRLGLGESVVLLPSYNQQQAPAVFNQAHILLHSHYNDACPAVVAEAMACGLPVVYSASGGVPELVGKEGGVGVPASLDWEKIHPPDPEPLAGAVLEVADNWEHYSQAARQRAVDGFALEVYVSQHRQIFEELVHGAT